MRGVAVLVALSLFFMVVHAEKEIEDIVEQHLEEIPDVEDNAQIPVRGRTFKEWGKKFWDWMGWGDDYYEYEEVYYYPVQHQSSYSSYGAPDAYGSSGSASGASSYVSYQPAPHYHGHHSPSRGDHVEDEWSFTDLMYDVAVSVIPMSLLLSSLPAGFFTLPIRRREFPDNSIFGSDFDTSQIPLLSSLMIENLFNDPECQRKLFCEVSLIGQDENATLTQRAIYYVASLTPDYIADRFGVGNLFRASRDGACSAFRCSSSSVPSKVTSFDPLDTNKLEPDEKGADSEKDVAGDSKN
ncbi:uncharacterized protein LOC143026922 [Oratosquilla oratoria]|uniref:uncharacterized protein LOC143026922 n=1 Tax=Oratosquilla oratoria TaxID=337810 RepID=UPI003F775D31